MGVTRWLHDYMNEVVVTSRGNNMEFTYIWNGNDMRWLFHKVVGYLERELVLEQ